MFLKDESNRLKSNSFKILGSSSAILGHYNRMAGGVLKTYDDLYRYAKYHPIVICTASDGNFGISVAYFCRMLELSCIIFLPDRAPEYYIKTIRELQGNCKLINGSYDDCVLIAKQYKREHNVCLILDTAIDDADLLCARDVISGYSTLFYEIEENFDYIFIQVGVGGLAAAAISSICTKTNTKCIAVEPETFNCIQRSILAGSICHSSGEQTLINGLSCNTPSIAAWEVLRNGIYAAVTIKDKYCVDIYKLLKRRGYETGVTGASSYAGYIQSISFLPTKHKALCLNTEKTNMF